MVEDVINSGFNIERLVEPIPASKEGFTERDVMRLWSQPWYLLIEARKPDVPR